MTEKIGVATRYHTRLPHQWELERIVDLSKDAKRRLKWIDYYLKHGNARKTCRYFGISQTTFYKWLNRHKKLGLKGLEEFSRKPKNFRVSNIPYDTIDIIVKLRKQYPAWSKYKLKVILKRDYDQTISASTIGRILKKKNLINQIKSSKLKRAAKRRVKRQKAQKYLKELSPGSLVYIDTKHLNFTGAKFYQFTAIDSKTRIKFIKIYSKASSKSGQLFLGEAQKYMPFKIQNIQTDNGSEYLKYFHEELEKQSIPHYFADPYCPKQNARVERVIQTSEYEFWHFNPGYELREINELADEWMYIYNNIRPHQSLNYLTPMEYFESLDSEGKIEKQVSTM